MATLDRVQFYSHITLDFAHFEQKYQDKNSDIFVDKYKPVANNYTRSLVCFEGNNDSVGMTQEALGYKFSIYRNQIGDRTLEPIYTTSVGQLSIVDYNVRNQKEYQYYVFKEDDDTLTSSRAALSNVARTCWWDYAVIGMELDDEDTLIYHVDPSDIWLFQSNVASDSTTQNFAKTTYQTLEKYPTVSAGKSNYASGSFSGLIGRVRGNKYVEDATLLEDWNDFCANSQLKLFKDRKGHKYIVDVTGSSSQVEDATREQATTVSVSWTQVGNADDYVIIGN